MNDLSRSKMVNLEIYNTQKISFRDFYFFNHNTQEFNPFFLINFDKSFVINSPSIIRELKKQKRKYSVVKDFVNAFTKAKVGRTYFFQNGKIFSVLILNS